MRANKFARRAVDDICSLKQFDGFAEVISMVGSRVALFLFADCNAEDIVHSRECIASWDVSFIRELAFFLLVCLRQARFSIVKS